MFISNALADGASIPWSYFAMASLALVPAVAAALAAGVAFINERDLQ